MDIRQLNISIKNINFIIQDLNKVDKKYFDSYDSISCLHALEHIGLGRYGDEVDPNGHIKGFNNLYNLLKTDQVISQLVPIIDALELLLESLHQYLHTKRMLYFPFFFA